MYFSLMIEGDARIAAIECAARGIEPYAFMPAEHGRIVVRARCEGYRTLQRWFTEVYGQPMPLRNAAALAPGTLLLFTPLDADSGPEPPAAA